MCFIWLSTVLKSDGKEAKAHLKPGTKNALAEDRSAYAAEAERGAGEGRTRVTRRRLRSGTREMRSR